jgi:hypothetical protein
MGFLTCPKISPVHYGLKTKMNYYANSCNKNNRWVSVGLRFIMKITSFFFLVLLHMGRSSVPCEPFII